LEIYQVPVRNEATGEIRLIAVLSISAGEAQIEALRLLFREEGWRKATALVPQMAVEPVT
jgi:hypothetical protein